MNSVFVRMVHTKSLQSVSHSLVLHHVNQTSAQTEVREDQEHVLQDVVDATNLLENNEEKQAQFIQGFF